MAKEWSLDPDMDRSGSDQLGLYLNSSGYSEKNHENH
jgi:hypothetical protein